MGPTVWELEGPMPILNRSNALIDKASYRRQDRTRLYRVSVAPAKIADTEGNHYGNAQSTRTMMRDCDRAIDQGSSIVMFPEGTRSANGRLRSFKQPREAFQIVAEA